MAEEPRIAPPPMRQGYGSASAEPVGYRQPLVVPPNDTKQLVRQGFWLGIGIALAFAAISAVLWLLAMILFAAALGG